MEKSMFYDDVISNPKDSDDDDIVRIINSNSEMSGFYELCSKYLEIALNADKWVDENTNELKCLVKYTDIESAKVATFNFVSDHRLQNLESLLSMIKGRYQEAVSDDESRQTSGVIRNNDLKNSAMGLYGTYYILTQIPNWEIVEKDIIEYVKTETSK
jgi:hypothetical protein